MSASSRRPLLWASLLSLILFFGLGEIGARTLHLVDRLNGFPRRLYQATDDEDLPYLLRPGVDTIARGVRVRINEHGMRGGPVPNEPPTAKSRVLLLGDSVTFGYRLEEEQTFGHLLREALTRRLGRPIEVLNAGVEGYNTQNQLAQLRRFGLGLQPDAIVLAFNLNDYDYGPVMGPMGVLTLERERRVSTWSLANLSEFYLLLRWLVATGGTVWVGDVPPAEESGAGEFNDFDRYVSKLRKQWYANPKDDRWATLVASLQGLRAEVVRRGIPLLIALLPDGDQIHVDDPDVTPQETLLPLCAEVGLDCVDLRPAFEAAREPHLFLDIMHPNAKGHAIIASRLEDWAARALELDEDPANGS